MTQIETAYDTLLNTSRIPRNVALGGDHSIVLPILRSLHKVYGKVHMIHFDAHLDTYTFQGELSHGNMLAKAAGEGLLAKSIHVGIRARSMLPNDFDIDRSLGFQHITTDAIDEMGVKGIVAAVLRRVGKGPAYISLDVDVLDPAFVPATGTPEPGGFTSREVKQILRGLRGGLNLIGADVVELAPAYDTQAETSAIAAADIVQELLVVMNATPALRKVDEL